MRRMLMAAVAVGLVAVGADAGAVGGPRENTTRVKARTTDVYNISFRGGETARIVVDGDGDTDLDLYVYDQNGNLIAKDDDNTDYCVVSWTPRFTGPFTIRVVNRGTVWNEYKITTN
jgi:hypothetical protein